MTENITSQNSGLSSRITLYLYKNLHVLSSHEHEVIGQKECYVVTQGNCLEVNKFSKHPESPGGLLFYSSGQLHVVLCGVT